MPSVEQIAVRAALPEELPGLLEIERQASSRFETLATGSGDFGDLVVPADETPVEELLAAIKEGLCWLATVGERRAGFVYGTALQGAETLFVEELDVLVEFGRRGIGTLLMETLELRAGELGLMQIALTTFREVPWNAPWYERLGFAEVNPDLAAADLRLAWETEAARGFDSAQRVLMTKPVGLAAGAETND